MNLLMPNIQTNNTRQVFCSTDLDGCIAQTEGSTGFHTVTWNKALISFLEDKLDHQISSNNIELIKNLAKKTYESAAGQAEPIAIKTMLKTLIKILETKNIDHPINVAADYNFLKNTRIEVAKEYKKKIPEIKNAKKFIEEIDNIGEVGLCTSSITEIARVILKRTEMYDLFTTETGSEKIIAADSISLGFDDKSYKGSNSVTPWEHSISKLFGNKTIDQSKFRMIFAENSIINVVSMLSVFGSRYKNNARIIFIGSENQQQHLATQVSQSNLSDHSHLIIPVENFKEASVEIDSFISKEVTT